MMLGVMAITPRKKLAIHAKVQGKRSGQSECNTVCTRNIAIVDNTQWHLGFQDVGDPGALGPWLCGTTELLSLRVRNDFLRK
jgi:hypothetical protein